MRPLSLSQVLLGVINVYGRALYCCMCGQAARHQLPYLCACSVVRPNNFLHHAVDRLTPAGMFLPVHVFRVDGTHFACLLTLPCLHHRRDVSFPYHDL